MSSKLRIDESRHENGHLFTQKLYRDGKLEGKYKIWYENGQLSSQVCYRNGKIDGEYKLWSKDGTFWNHQYCLNSKFRSFSQKAKKGFLQAKKYLRNYIIYSSDIMLINDLAKMVKNF
jgi:antitoxin component YwqK of YwqJK toxin-antitoxin module